MMVISTVRPLIVSDADNLHDLASIFWTRNCSINATHIVVVVLLLPLLVVLIGPTVFKKA